MKLSSYTLLLAMLGALLLVFTNCGKERGPSSLTLKPADGPAVSVQPVSRGQPELTAEDEMLLKMPYEQRLQYLRQRYRELVFELHGIRIEDDVGPSKAARSLDEEHRVEGDNNNPPPPDEQWYRQETVNEYINLQRDGDNWQWTLSFLERLYADYDFNGVAAIGDITPLAMYYGDFWEQYNPGEWPDNNDPHLDRISDHSGKIGIADITPLAQNFGKKLIGYNVYFLPYNQAGWQQSGKLLARWRLTDTGNWEDTGYPTSESFQTA